MRFKVKTKPPFQPVDNISLKVARELGLPIAMVREVMSHVFQTKKAWLDNPSHTKLKIPHFGTYSYRHKFLRKEYIRVNKFRKKAERLGLPIDKYRVTLSKLASLRHFVFRSDHLRKYKKRFDSWHAYTRNLTHWRESTSSSN